MIARTALVLSSLLLAGCAVQRGEFSSSPNLLPSGCTESDDRLCRVSDRLSFRPDAPQSLLWTAVAYVPGNDPIGTTDGASIPEALWPLIGGPYTPEFIRPAILHDHYTFPENRVRTWQDTHRMFLHALLAEDVEPVKAYLMYYAVYVFGGHWAEFQLPEECDDICEQYYARFDNRRVSETPSMDSERAEEDLLAVWAIFNDPSSGIIQADQAATIQAIEDLARQRHPENFFLQHGRIVPLTREVAECLNLIPDSVSPHAP